MAASEIPTSAFRDFSTSTYGGPGLNLTDITQYTVLLNGAGNGVKFSFSQAGWLVLKNSGGTSVVFTILMPEPAQYSALGITITDKTVTVAANQTHILSVDSRYQHADGFVYVESNTASNGNAQVIKRYTIA